MASVPQHLRSASEHSDFDRQAVNRQWAGG
jgi:hypothetical protein